MITLDGKPLLIEDVQVDLRSWMNRFQALADLREFADLPKAIQSDRKGSRNGQTSGVGLPVPNYSEDRDLKINTLYWPSGAARWAHGLFLADGDTVASLPAVIGDEVTLVMGDPDHSQITTKLYLLPPHPISAYEEGAIGTAEEPGKTLWLLPLVDARYWWQYKHLEDFEVDGGTTWDDLLTQIATQLGVTLTFPAIDAEYLHPDPPELTRKYDNAALLLDAVSASIGLRVTRSLSGTVQAQNVTIARETVFDNLQAPYQLIAGGDYTDKEGHRPESWVVTFPKWSWHVPWCSGDLHKVTVGGVSGTSVADTVGVVHSAAYADMTLVAPGSPPNNQTVLEDLANKIVTDADGWFSKNYDFTFAGMQAWVPNGFDDCIEFGFAAQLDDGRQVAQTRVSSTPHNHGVEQQLSQHFNWCVLDHFQIGKAIQKITPKSQQGTGYGEVQIWDTEAGNEEEIECDPVRAYLWFDDEIKNGEKVWLRWHCEENAWYVFPGKPAPSGPLIGYKLTGPRTRKTDGSGRFYGDAPAIVEKSFDGGPAVGSAITIAFFDRLDLGAVAASEGLAEWRIDDEDGKGYWVDINCQEQTAHIEFELLENRDIAAPQQDVEAKLLWYGGHSNAVIPPATQQGGCGTTTWTWTSETLFSTTDYKRWYVPSLGGWFNTVPANSWYTEAEFINCSEGCSPVPPSGTGTHGQSVTTDCAGTPVVVTKIKVRFRAGDYPLALGPEYTHDEVGARGTARLDVQWNKTADDQEPNLIYWVERCEQLTPDIAFEHGKLCLGEQVLKAGGAVVNRRFHPFSLKAKQFTIDNPYLATLGGEIHANISFEQCSDGNYVYNVYVAPPREDEFLMPGGSGSPCTFRKVKKLYWSCDDVEDYTVFTTKRGIAGFRYNAGEPDSGDAAGCPTNPRYEVFYEDFLACEPCEPPVIDPTLEESCAGLSCPAGQNGYYDPTGAGPAGCYVPGTEPQGYEACPTDPCGWETVVELTSKIVNTLVFDDSECIGQFQVCIIVPAYGEEFIGENVKCYKPFYCPDSDSGSGS